MVEYVKPNMNKLPGTHEQDSLVPAWSCVENSDIWHVQIMVMSQILFKFYCEESFFEVCTYSFVGIALNHSDKLLLITICTESHCLKDNKNDNIDIFYIERTKKTNISPEKNMHIGLVVV